MILCQVGEISIDILRNKHVENKQGKMTGEVIKINL
jgi:hypothetical protein